MLTISESELKVHLMKVNATKAVVELDGKQEVSFRINAKIEDEEKKPDHARVKFELSISTDPKFATLELEGLAEVTGDSLGRLEKTDPSGNVPLLVFDLYRRLYPMVYLMANSIDSPAPSPALLSAPDEPAT
ncbi:MAG: hypothetical protein ACE5KG_05800 [Nitrososphaerales archaeon]